MLHLMPRLLTEKTIIIVMIVMFINEVISDSYQVMFLSIDMGTNHFCTIRFI